MSKYQTGREWASVLCFLKQGQFVNISLEMPFILRGEYHGGVTWRSGKFLTTGWYRVQMKFYDGFDEEFLCLEAKSYIKMAGK